MEYITLTKMMYMLKTYPLKRKQTYLVFCRGHRIPCRFDGGKWFVSRKYVEAARKWRQEAAYISDIIGEMLSREELSSDLWHKNQRNLTRKISKYISSDNEYSILFDGKFVDTSKIETVRDIIANEKSIVFGRKELISISDAQEQMRLSSYQIKRMIDDGIIGATKLNNNYFISPVEIDSYTRRKSGLIGVFDVAAEICKEKDSNFDISERNDRLKLNNFIRLSPLAKHLLSWDDVELHEDRRNALYVPVSKKDELEILVRDYISNYGMPFAEFSKCLENAYWDTHPETRELLVRFGIDHKDTSMAAIGACIIATLNKELSISDNTSINAFCEKVSELGVRQYQKDLVNFIAFVKSQKQCSFDIDIKLESTKQRSATFAPSTLPYSTEQFFSFYRICVNPESIKAHDLYSKAIENVKLSYAWLYSCWHLIAAWRKGDIDNQIPIIDIPYSWGVIRSEIFNDSFGQIAFNYSMQLQSIINNGNLLPHKTEKKQKERFLTISIPSSIAPVLGRVYIIYAKHLTDNHRLNRTLSFNDYYLLFGDDYYRTFGQNAFSNRRGNKAYLNSLSEIISITGGISSYTLSYQVASYARSHKEANHGLAPTTSKYLMHKMDGLDVNEVLIRLFDNGFCSFTVRYLLEIAYGERFALLGFKDQSDLVHEMGLSAYHAENIARLINDSYIRSRKTVDELLANFKSYDSKQNNALQTLDSLSSRMALTNIGGVSCLIIATKRRCPYRYNRSCIGCRYSICDLSFFTVLINEVNKAFIGLRNAKTAGTQELYQTKLDNELIPLTYEIIFFAKKQFNFDVEIYAKKLIEIIERRGLNNND